ncbi:hypothetical protein N9M10_05640 [Hellea sp.]|nr:hypothetical protein [Hellea sp.]
MTDSAFVIDDEIFIALDIENHLVDLGFDIIGPASKLDEGFDIINESSEKPDIAVMDINIGGDLVWPLARKLHDEGTKVIFISANCNHKELDTEFKDCPVVDKPASYENIADAIELARESLG